MLKWKQLLLRFSDCITLDTFIEEKLFIYPVPLCVHYLQVTQNSLDSGFKNSSDLSAKSYFPHL